MKKSAPLAQARAVTLAVLALGAGLAAAQTPPAAAAAPEASASPAAPTPGAQAQAVQQVDVFEYIVRGNTVLDARTIELAVTPFLGPQRSLKDIEAARDALLAAYQAKGYQSVYVDLPEQQVTDGLVFLQVTETRVGRVRVVGAEYNSPVEVRDQVPALAEGKVPDFTQAQAELTALNRGGRRQVMPLVRQGAMPGTMDVDLKVEDKNPWRASIGLNNDYSADTEKLRVMGSLGHDNLWQAGHSASISFFGTPQDLNQTQVWSGSYSMPLRGSNWALEFSGYHSDSNVSTVGGTSVLGKGYSIGVKTSYTVPDSGAWWHNFSVGVDFKNNKEALQLGDTSDEVPLKYAPITLAYSGYYQGEKLQAGVGVSLVTGTRTFAGWGSDWEAFNYKRYKASPSFQIAKLDFNGSYTFDNDLQVGWRASGQITDSPLVSGEQIAAGGMNSVRGYLSAEATGDVGVVGSLELRSPRITWLGEHIDNWRAHVFFDAGWLRLRSPLPEQEDRFRLASVGVGTSLRVGQHVNARLEYGYPLRHGPRTERHDPRLTFSVNVTF
ncbi:ShlB/FhaC/HecB family hemolysin secretion/activation protein [Xenophilus arseniciresistens]|uniref:ShlB/FhaC/HecB family hemolysin secretion/activation protein n=1 Tax=Xenophilus arseniciresistens TaxID=1283306 RepID=A0AAE3N5M6_9BURK|nr:ShlB/FhaC/HecB family hemolysin secretion/activation protein [Xenophilus arseniciresistens]MDA7414999.1 ShlB/FhaC/HecB family hemolysin secretion/activation protein [Xenophilus arseniciresistens]